MSGQHTPGPWTVHHLNFTKVTNHKGGLIAHCNSRFWSELDEPNSDYARANARLIAASPRLLEALEALVGHCVEQERLITEELYRVAYCGESMPLCDARAAIAKARGEA